MAQQKQNTDSAVVIIGAGQAGFAAAARLRALGHTGPVTLVGEEAQPPYQRPPLSKAYLLGSQPLERMFFRAPEFYAQNNIELRLSCRVTAIDRKAHLVQLEGGDSLPYDKLLLTTGAEAVRLPAAIGGDLGGVHYVRTLADADHMAENMQPGKKVLIVGGGYIGLEAAAVACGLGLDVVLVEAAERILQRVASVETSDYFRKLHANNGVQLRENTQLAALIGENGHVTGARLADGSELAVDLVIVGIGIRPNDQLARAAGLTIENGIRVDEFGCTSDPDIFAAGDCASFPYRGGRIRLESVGNAVDQAEAAIGAITGNAQPYVARPWFWSDQYDVKLQIAGLSSGYDRIVTRKGDKEGSVSFWYFAADQLLAVDAMNDPRAYMAGKRMIETGKSPSPALVADPEIQLKSLLA